MSTVFRWGWALWRDDLPALAAITGLSVGSAALLTAFPWAWQHAITTLGGAPADLRAVTVHLASIAVAQWLLYMALQGARATMNARIEWRARERVFDHLTRLDPEVFRRWSTGDLVTRLYDDAGEKVSWFLCSGVFRAWEAGLILVSCLGAMAMIDPWVTLWICAPLPLLMLAQAASQAALGGRFGAVQASISAINDHLTATFEGLRVVQANGLGDGARRVFAERARAQLDAEVSVARIQQAVQLQYGQGWQLAVIGLLLPGGHAVIAQRISTAEFIALEGLVMTLVWPMFDLGIFVSRLPQTRVALQRLDAVLAEPTRSTTGDARPDRPSVAALAAEVRADDGATLLRGLSFDAGPGARVALAGPVGSGKSTAMALLAGLRRPTTGAVTLGDVPLDRVALDHARAQVAFVPQDPVLLSASIRDNILLGREVPEADLQRAVAIAQLARDLDRLPQGLDTVVGARGQTLSGGQQQRVAIARAVVGRPRVLLLDDATAALDADTEAAFWDALSRELPDTTCVVVTHRAATLAAADRVITLAAATPDPT